MLITYGLLAILFIVGLLATFLQFPTKSNFTTLFKSSSPKTSSAINVKIPDQEEKATKKVNNNFKAELESVFGTFDKNNDGYITKQELKESLKNVGIAMAEKDVKETIERVDSNGDGLIDLNEFCDMFGSMVSSSKDVDDQVLEEGELKVEEGEGEGYLKEAFNVFDGDGDGVITVEELGLVLSSLGFIEGKKMENCKEMIRNVDMDGDGMINFDEFKKMMKAGNRLLPVY